MMVLINGLYLHHKKYLSYHPMATSETKEQIIRLGEILVASLGEKHEVSPACHWMSHYLAEQMTAADTTFGEEREQAQKSCFDTILRLWKARRDFPRGVHAVSYTHLDVYKRQILVLRPPRVLPMACLSAPPAGLAAH